MTGEWKIYPPYFSSEEVTEMIGVLKPWLVFGIVATVITAILGVGSVLWTLGLRPKRWAKREREPLQDGLDEEGHPLDPFAIQHHLKKLERKRFAALLVIFCVLLLFAALGTFVYYINNRTSENISSSNVDLTVFSSTFASIITGTYENIPNLMIKQALHPFYLDALSVNDTIITLSTDFSNADSVRWTVTLAVHSVAFLVLILLLVGALRPKIMVLFLAIAFPVLIALWGSTCVSSMSGVAISYSCDTLNGIVGNSTLYPASNYNTTVEVFLDCLRDGRISNTTQNTTQITYAIQQSNTTIASLGDAFNEQLNHNNIDAQFDYQAIYDGQIVLGDEATIANSLQILNFTFMSLNNAEAAISASNLTQSQIRALMNTAEGIGECLSSLQEIVALGNCTSIQSVYQSVVQDLICYDIQSEIEWLGIASLVSGIFYVGLVIYAITLTNIPAIKNPEELIRTRASNARLFDPNSSSHDLYVPVPAVEE